MKEIEFWFSIGSTYTYLSVTRLKEVEQKFEVKFSWQPFSVRKIMLEMDNVPFPPTKQVKADYMWRDIERRARSYGFEAKVPIFKVGDLKIWGATASVLSEFIELTK